jgi:hypothetical protein
VNIARNGAEYYDEKVKQVALLSRDIGEAEDICRNRVVWGEKEKVAKVHLPGIEPSSW